MHERRPQRNIVGLEVFVLEPRCYGSTCEVVRAALEFLEEHEARLEALRCALIAGEQSGPSKAFDFDAFIEARRSAD